MVIALADVYVSTEHLNKVDSGLTYKRLLLRSPEGHISFGSYIRSVLQWAQTMPSHEHTDSQRRSHCLPTTS